MPLYLLADGLDGCMRAQKAVGQCLVFAQQTQQQMLRLNVRRTKLAGLVSCKANDAPGFLRIPLEHIPLTRMRPVTSAGNITLSFWLLLLNLSRKKLSVLASAIRHDGLSCCAGQTCNLPNGRFEP